MREKFSLMLEALEGCCSLSIKESAYRDALRELKHAHNWIADLNESITKLREDAERRDASAGEPVAWQFLTDSGEWFDIHDPDEAAQYGYKVRGLFPAAQPSALPPEVDNWHNSASGIMNAMQFNGDAISFTVGANWMREKVKELGCKAIKLPECMMFGDAVYRQRVEAALERQGFTVEGE